MIWRFFVNGTEIIEPVGWDSLRVKLERGQHHGINFVYSANALGFTCAEIGSLNGGAEMLLGLYNSDDYLTNLPVLRVEYSCNGQPFKLFSEFNLNMSGLKNAISQGQVLVPIEQTGGRQQLANNYELAINYFSEIDVNGNPFARPPQALQVVHLPPLAFWTQNLLSFYDTDLYVQGQVYPGVAPYVPGNVLRGAVQFNNVLVDEPDNFANSFFSWVTVGPTPSNQVIISGKLDTELTVTGWGSGLGAGTIYEIFASLRVNGTYYGTVSIWSGAQALAPGQTFAFTWDYSNTFASISYPGITEIVISVDAKETIFGIDYQSNVNFDMVFFNSQTSNFLEVVEKNQIDTPNGVDLPATLIHEAFSVPVALCSGQQIEMESTILGRQDSYPIAYGSDGAWSNVAILSGLMLRRFPAKAENVGYDPYTYSIKQLFEAVRAFFPLGWGFLGEKIYIEAIPFFYKDDISVVIDAGILTGDISVELNQARTYNRAMIGFDDWKIDGYNALEEFNTKLSYSTNWQSVNAEFNATGKIFTQQSRIVNERLRDYRENPGDAEDSTDFYALWLDRTTILSPTKDVLQGVTAGTKIKDITTAINWSFNPSDSMQRYINLYLSDFQRFAGGEGNTEATATAQTAGQTVSVTYPDSTVYYPASYSEPINPTTINANLGAGQYRRNENIRVKGYLTVENFTEILANPYERIQVNVGTETYIGWILSADFVANDGECELILLLS